MEKEAFSKLNMADYTKKSFGMYGGKEEKVKLLIHNDLVGVIIDRFGRDIMLFPADADHVTANVDVHGQPAVPGLGIFTGPKCKNSRTGGCCGNHEERSFPADGTVRRLICQSTVKKILYFIVRG